MSAGASEIRAGGAYVEIGGEEKPLNSALKRASQKLESWSASLAGLGTKFAALGTAMAAPLYASLGTASAYEESLNRFQVVFGENADAVQQWSESHAAAINRSKLDMLNYLGTAQSLFTGLGIGEDNAAGLSVQITKLASDMGSFWDVSDEDAFARLASAIVGETEAVRRWGIDISAVAVEQELLRMGIQKSSDEITQQEKVLARMNIIMRSTQKQQGDAARTSDSYANSVRGLWAQIENLRLAIGTHLLPVVTPYVQKMAEAVRTAGEWIERNSELVTSIQRMTVTVLAIGAALLSVAGILMGLSVLMSPMGLIGVAIAGFVALLDALDVVDTGFKTFFENIRVGGRSIGQWLNDGWVEILKGFARVEQALYQGWDYIETSAQAAADYLQDAFWDSLAAIRDAVKRMYIEVQDAKNWWTMDDLEYGKAKEDVRKQADELFGSGALGGASAEERALRDAKREAEYAKRRKERDALIEMIANSQAPEGMKEELGKKIKKLEAPEFAQPDLSGMVGGAGGAGGSGITEVRPGSADRILGTFSGHNIANITGRSSREVSYAKEYLAETKSQTEIMENIERNTAQNVVATYGS